MWLCYIYHIQQTEDHLSFALRKSDINKFIIALWFKNHEHRSWTCMNDNCHPWVFILNQEKIDHYRIRHITKLNKQKLQWRMMQKTQMKQDEKITNRKTECRMRMSPWMNIWRIQLQNGIAMSSQQNSGLRNSTTILEHEPRLWKKSK